MRNGRVADADVKLECTNCPPRDRVSENGDENFTELPARNDFEQRDGDPKSVVRCAECGKKHSRKSLVDVNTPGGA